MKYEKLNIEIINEQYFDRIEELEDCIRLYKDDTLQFIVYKNSNVHANDNSTMFTYDSSIVCAHNSSIVYAYNSSKTYAYNNSTIHASDHSTVCVYNDSKVYAYNGSIIFAYGNSKVNAYGNSTIYAYDKSTVYAYNNSTVNASNRSTVYAKVSSRVHAYSGSTVHAYSGSTIYAYGDSTVEAKEFSTLYIKSRKVKIKTENHFGAIIKQVHKLKKYILVYKKLRDEKIATLQLVKGQTFQSERFGKCRTDRVIVVSITNIDNTEEYQSGVSIYNSNFVYEVGKVVVADEYDECINECSDGIHFFLTREQAVEYIL